MKFTKATVTALTLPAGRTDHFEWDDELPSFGIRLRGKARRWVVQYRVGSQQRRESLGDVRKVTLDDARKVARQRFALVELGVDPAADKAKARAAAAAAGLTLAVVVEGYLNAKKDRLRPRTFNQATLHFREHWSPLRHRPVDSIKRADVAALLQEIAKERGRTAAARARGNLSALFVWAMKEGLCEANPVAATNDPHEGILPRDRVLDDDEIRVIWNACDDDDSGRITKLLLLTGCRREEIGGLRWSEVNLDTGSMTIPGERTKNRRTLELVLPVVAIELLAAASRRDRVFVFGRYDHGFSGWGAAKLRLDSRIVLMTGKTIPAWVFHDLRRTYRTGLGRLGVPPHVAELAINHAKAGIEAVYDKHRYLPEIKQALTLWAAHVCAVVEARAPTVVPLRA